MTHNDDTKRKRHHSWAKNIRPTLNEKEKEKCEDNGKEIEVYYEPGKRDSNGIIIGCI